MTVTHDACSQISLLISLVRLAKPVLRFKKMFKKSLIWHMSGSGMQARYSLGSRAQGQFWGNQNNGSNRREHMVPSAKHQIAKVLGLDRHQISLMPGSNRAHRLRKITGGTPLPDGYEPEAISPEPLRTLGLDRDPGQQAHQKSPKFLTLGLSRLSLSRQMRISVRMAQIAVGRRRHASKPKPASKTGMPAPAIGDGVLIAVVPPAFSCTPLVPTKLRNEIVSFDALICKI